MVTNDPWSALVSQTVLGTRQGQALTADGLLGEALARVPAGDVATATALITAWRRAGRRPTHLAHAAVAAPAETLPEASAAATRLVQRFLSDGGEEELIRPWIEACAAAGQKASDLDIPRLLDLGRAQPHMREPIRRIIGARGGWLATQQDAWAWATAPASAGDWSTSTGQERLALVRQIRRADPAAARHLIESTWSDDAPADRAAFLGVLKDGLTLADEPLLERALDDRRKEVRQIALDLCRALPGAALAQRCHERLARCWTWSRPLIAQRLTITPPTAYDKSWARDGIDAKPPTGIGERAWWLQQLVSAVPVAHWTDAWDCTPAEAIAALAKTDWEEPFIQGLIASSYAQPDARWIAALMTHRLGADHAPQLLQALAGPERERLLGGFLPVSGTEGRNFIALVDEIDCHWSPDFSQRVITVMQQQPSADWFRRISSLARRLDPMATAALAALPHDEATKPALDAALSLLDLRRQIAKEFA
jgi:hypothetical protein